MKRPRILSRSPWPYLFGQFDALVNWDSAMSFWDDVYEIREKNLIPRVWKATDLIPHLHSYAYTTSLTNPANYSITRYGEVDGGYHVKSGSKPRAWRYSYVGSTLEYELIRDPGDDELIQIREEKLSLERAMGIRIVGSSKSMSNESVPYFRPAAEATPSAQPSPSYGPDDRYPLRGMPYRYDGPFDGVALVEEDL